MVFGVKWLASPSVFSPATGTIDLSSHGVPTDADFAILYQLGGDSNVDDVYYYKVGGSHSGSNPNVRSYSLQTIIVPLVNAQVACEENGIGNAYVAGYGYGGYWPDGKTSKSTSTTGSWLDKDVSSELPNAKLVCWEVYSVNGFYAGVREKGSTDTFTPSPLYHYWAYCGADASQVCQIYDGYDASHYIYGAFLTTDTGLKVNTNWVNIPTTATGWQTYDASAGITAGHKAVLLFFTGFTGSHTYGVRKVDSGFDVTGEGCSSGAWAMVELDENGQFEAYISTTDIDIYIVASFPEYDLYANDRIYVWLGDSADPEQYELTDPSYPTGLAVRTERGRDEELGHAAAGIAEITCDNHYGDFSPENSEGQYYGTLKLGAVITVYEIYAGTTYRHFKGKIDKIEPHPEPDNLTAYILALDGSDDLAGSEIETVLRTDTDESQLVEDALDGAGWSEGKDLDAGVDTLQLGWWHQIYALPAIHEMEESTRGFFLVDVDGTALWQNRHHRVTGDRLVSQYDFNELLTEIGYQWSKRDVKNWARVTGYKYIDPYYGLPEEEWLWYAPAGDQSAPYVPANSTIIVWAPLAGPRKSSDTLVKGTHWNANTVNDKTGIDVSDDITVTPTYYGQAIKFTIENSGDHDCYLVVPDSPPSGAPDNTTLLVYGTIYEEVVMAVVEEDSTSKDDYGKRTISIDARFKSNYNDILAYGQWLISRFKDPLPSPIMARINAWTNYPDDTIKIQCLTRKISDRITIASTKLGIDQDYFIDKIIQEYVMLEGGTVHLTTYSLSRTDGQAEGLYWILGIAGFSELGLTTRLGF